MKLLTQPRAVWIKSSCVWAAHLDFTGHSAVTEWFRQRCNQPNRCVAMWNILMKKVFPFFLLNARKAAPLCPQLKLPIWGNVFWIPRNESCPGIFYYCFLFIFLLFFYQDGCLSCFCHAIMTADVMCICHLLLSQRLKTWSFFSFQTLFDVFFFFFSIKPWFNTALPQKHGPSQLQSNLLFNFNSGVTNNSKSRISGEC